MKKIPLLSMLFFLLLTLVVNAQTPPNAFNYSAVARNATGLPIATTTIGIQVTILKTSPTGASQYSENHFVNTDVFGLFNLVIGAGAVQSGSMASIDWSNDNYYLKVGMDATGGTNFVTMGTTQLLSVPYAMYAKSAGSVSGITITSVSSAGDTLYLSNGQSFVAGGSVSGITITSVSSAGDTLYLSNGQSFVAGGSGGGTGGKHTHYIGEEFGGGVIFHLWKDNAGVEHGLIVDKTDLSTSQVWSNIDLTLIGPSAQSSWDGLSNSNAIVAQAGHTNSAAALCLNSTNGAQSDWYLPSIDELSLLWHSRFNVNKSLSAIGGATVLPRTGFYWSSTEIFNRDAWNFHFDDGAANYSGKNLTFYVRAVRAF